MKGQEWCSDVYVRALIVSSILCIAISYYSTFFSPLRHSNLNLILIVLDSYLMRGDLILRWEAMFFMTILKRKSFQARANLLLCLAASCPFSPPLLISYSSFHDMKLLIESLERVEKERKRFCSSLGAEEEVLIPSPKGSCKSYKGCSPTFPSKVETRS